jgi:hypothetical protein
MKFVNDRPLADPDATARKLQEIANATEPAQPAGSRIPHPDIAPHSSEKCVLASYERSYFRSFLTKLGFIPGCHPGSWLGPTNMGKCPSGILAGTSWLWRERPRRAVMNKGASGEYDP